MDYLWRNYSPKTRYELDPSLKHSTPSVEVSFRKDALAIINPLPRFADIFHNWLKQRDLWANQNEKMQELSNFLLHFLAQIDLVSGISSTLIFEDELERALLNGNYGENIGKLFCNLTRERQLTVIDFLRRQENSKGRKLYFREALKEIFPCAKIYFYNPDKIFLICLPQEENITDSNCVSLLVNLFLDVTDKWQIYWRHPFGIIEQEHTMRINGMRIYDTRKEL